MVILQASPVLAALSALAFGLLVGSFLNVVILRMPPRLEWQWRRDCRELLELPELSAEADPKPPGIVVQRSHCPGCGHQLAAWENVPVLSWLLLRGRCRGCGMRISAQYPVVELLTGLLFAICVWQFGWTWQAGAAIVFTGLLVAMSGIDLRTTLLPDQLTLPLLWLGLLLSVVVPGGLFVPPVSAILGAAVGYLSLWSVYWAFKLLTGKEGMGYGDFKLLAALGAWCGVGAVLPIVLISSVVGAVIGSAWLMIKGRDKATPIPFGPYLAIAGWIVLVLQFDLLGSYARWVGMA
ncbi:prepilin peptidase [Alkalisalibacterium limincola]|nr:A24 family peptidase [Alkalisalibacterium limincola]